MLLTLLKDYYKDTCMNLEKWQFSISIALSDINNFSFNDIKGRIIRKELTDRLGKVN